MICHDYDYCVMEGCIYPDPMSPDLAARRAAMRKMPPSTCARCGKVNYGLRAYLAAQTRKRMSPTPPAQGSEKP